MSIKEKRIKRIMSQFIDVTDELINDIGISNITMRKIADKAGYNSATIYKYFENLDHLIFFASFRNTKEYTLNLSTYLKDSKNAMDTFLLVWECFCDHSYMKPEIYKAIFLVDLNKDSEHYIADYYSLFPEEIGDYDDTISNMLWTGNLFKRGMQTVNACVKDGYIQSEDAEKLNDITMFIFEGILQRLLKNKISYDDARNTTMDYIKTVVKSLLIKEYEFI